MGDCLHNIAKNKKSDRTRWLLTVLIIALWIFWEIAVEPAFLFNKTRWNHMMRVDMGFAGFNTVNNRLPVSLQEAVEKGFLPEKSKMYFCPMKHDTVFSKKLHYTDCEYEFVFEPNQVIIKIPREIWEAKKEYKWMVEQQSSLIVGNWEKIGDKARAYWPKNQPRTLFQKNQAD